MKSASHVPCEVLPPVLSHPTPNEHAAASAQVVLGLLQHLATGGRVATASGKLGDASEIAMACVEAAVRLGRDREKGLFCLPDTTLPCRR